MNETTIEKYGPYIVRCPQCKVMVDSIPAEGVPDQSLRACPKCELTFFLDDVEE